MRIIRVDDARDARLADYAGVRDPGLLQARGRLIAEGRFVVRRLIASGRVAFRSLLLNEAALAGLRDALESLDPAVEVYVASPDVITGATGFNIHRGCLALADRPVAVPVETVLATARLVVVLERVVDPDNIGSVFRNAEAFGVDVVLLSPGCGDPLYRKALRTSSGAALMVPFIHAAPWPATLSRLRAAGFTVVAMTPADDATNIGDFITTGAAQRKVAVLLGSEGDGLTPEALAHTDARVRIPISPTLDSLNIATAAAIALHRIRDRDFGSPDRVEANIAN